MSYTPEPQQSALAAGRPLLRARRLHKEFGNNTVLESIDLDINAGDVVALIGPSGSGKTTLLRCLNSLEIPQTGSIAVTNGPSIDFAAHPTKKQLHSLRDQSAMVFQHFNLFPHKTVLENVTEGPIRVQKRAGAVAEAKEILDSVGIADKADAYPFQLSGGQQQRVGIARAVAMHAPLLLFDEPTSALDPELVYDVLGVMRNLAAAGWTMIIVTHELGFAREVANQVFFMDGGVVVEHGTPQQVLVNPAKERTQRFVNRLLR